MTEQVELPPSPPRFSLWAVFILLFRALTGAHALTVYLILSLRFLADERNNLIHFFDETIHLGVVPAVGLLPLCLLLRRWGLALVLLPIVALCAFWYGPRLLPVEAVPADGPSISVLTYNIEGLNSSGRDWTPVLEVIIAADADVVAIQELSPDALDILGPALRAIYPHTALYPANGASGSGVFSRYPVLQDMTWQGAFINQRVVLDFDGQPLTLYNVHPPPPIGSGGFTFDVRNAEIDDIIARVDAEPRAVPLVIAGDFNMGDKTPRYEALQTRLGDAWAQVGQGLGLTFSPLAMLPLFRIDYIWYSDGLLPTRADVYANGGSDHQPVYAVFTLVVPSVAGSSSR